MDDCYIDKDVSRSAGDAESAAEIRERAADLIMIERERQISLAHGGDTEEFDRGNSQNDWIAYVNAYTGRAAQKVFRNEREGQTFVENMTKAAALCLAAVEAHLKGYC